MSDEIRSRGAALTALRRELTARGFGRKATGRVVIELAVHVVLAVGGLVVFFASDNLAVRIIGLLVSTAGSTGVGTNTHTSSHYATSERRWVNEALTFFGTLSSSGCRPPSGGTSTSSCTTRRPTSSTWTTTPTSCPGWR